MAQNADTTRTTMEITAHRGAMAEAPENTMRAFVRAVELGVDEIELDVHMSADGRLAVMHDASVDRTTDGTGPIGEKTWEQLQTLDAGQGERIPELEQVLDACPGMPFQIEVKDVRVTRRVLEVIQQRRTTLGRISITSFHPEAVADARVPGRWWRVGLICGKGQAEKIALGARAGVDGLYLHWSVLGDAAVAAFRQGGGSVFGWPVRNADDARQALARDLAGFTADDPAAALAVRDGSARPRLA